MLNNSRAREVVTFLLMIFISLGTQILGNTVIPGFNNLGIFMAIIFLIATILDLDQKRKKEVTHGNVKRRSTGIPATANIEHSRS